MKNELRKQLIIIFCFVSIIIGGGIIIMYSYAALFWKDPYLTSINEAIEHLSRFEFFVFHSIALIIIPSTIIVLFNIDKMKEYCHILIKIFSFIAIFIIFSSLLTTLSGLIFQYYYGPTDIIFLFHFSLYLYLLVVGLFITIILFLSFEIQEPSLKDSLHKKNKSKD